MKTCIHIENRIKLSTGFKLAISIAIHYVYTYIQLIIITKNSEVYLEDISAQWASALCAGTKPLVLQIY